MNTLLPQTYLLGLIGLLAIVAVVGGRQFLRVRRDEQTVPAPDRDRNLRVEIRERVHDERVDDARHRG